MQIKGYRFLSYYLDIAQQKLFCDDTEISLPDRNIQLLLLLAQHSPAPLTKKELHQTLWPNSVVSDWSLSRLVSDTRLALGDNGDNQLLIKTVRGQGFSMPMVERDIVEEITQTVDEAIAPETTNKDFPLVANKKNKKKLTLLVLTLITTITLGNWWLEQKQSAELQNAIATIKTQQDNAYTAFKAQVNRRNQLVAMIEQRLDIKRQRQYELFFQNYFEQMTEEEKFICQQVRVYSDTGLYQSNARILELLTLHPKIAQEIPLAEQLSQHLRIWINKYETVFKNRPDMCLVYVGVEDGVPYPSGVDQEVIAWLAEKG